MKRAELNKGFTLIELLTVVGILAVLAGALLSASKYVVTRAHEGLTESTISVIVTALEQYYDDNRSFPFVADYDVTAMPITNDLSAFITADLVTLVETDLGLPGVVTLNGVTDNEYASIEAMYYFLDRSYNSSKILSAISDKFITNKSSGGDLTIEWSMGTSGPKTTPLIRIVDAWGNALRYTYTVGDSFPVIVSAGRDGDFSTLGDNISSDDL